MMTENLPVTNFSSFIAWVTSGFKKKKGAKVYTLCTLPCNLTNALFYEGTCHQDPNSCRTPGHKYL